MHHAALVAQRVSTWNRPRPRPLRPMIEMEKITKVFPGGVVANREVDFKISSGQVHALLGENGSGKTTLMNILYGMHRATSGTISRSSQTLTIGSPSDAISHGIGMVHQHFMLVPTLTVAENVVLGTSAGPNRLCPFLNLREAEERIASLSREYRLDVDPRAEVWQLPVGAQQRVEIVKALYRDADVLILDEPTAVLTPQEANDLIDVLSNLASRGKSIVFISHKLNEVISLADEITVLRNGDMIGMVRKKDTDAKDLARMMVGRSIEPPELPNRSPGEPMLTVKSLCVEDDRKLEAVKDVSFTLRAGEILGVAGVDGNGQKELVEAIAGVRRAVSGSVETKHQGVSNREYARRIGHVTEDRLKTSVVLDFSLWENFGIKTCDTSPHASWLGMNIGSLKAATEAAISEFRIKSRGPDEKISSLSGGNQQKLVLARELGLKPDILLAAQPTRGLDVGAAEYVHQRLIEERQNGMAILLVSTELEEILAISDRVIVLYEGKIMGALAARKATREVLGLMMAGERLEEMERSPGERN